MRGRVETSKKKSRKPKRKRVDAVEMNRRRVTGRCAVKNHLIKSVKWAAGTRAARNSLNF
jgi:hypothetical protein